MSLVEDWKDRVPTEVLSNGAIRYEQFDSSGNSLGYIYIKRADEPSEVGNIWNKSTYDGIKDELGLKLNISSKATNAEAEEGTNDDKYMTPLKTKQAIEERLITRSYNIDVPVNNDLSATIDMDTYINSKTILLEFESYINKFAFSSSSDWIRWIINDSNPMFCAQVNDESYPSGRLYTTNFALAESKYKSYTKMLFDVKSKTFELIRVGGTVGTGTSSIVNSISKFYGIYFNNIGEIYPRRVERLSAKDFIKIKAYDSAEISNL